MPDTEAQVNRAARTVPSAATAASGPGNAQARPATKRQAAGPARRPRPPAPPPPVRRAARCAGPAPARPPTAAGWRRHGVRPGEREACPAREVPRELEMDVGVVQSRNRVARSRDVASASHVAPRGPRPRGDPGGAAAVRRRRTRPWRGSGVRAGLRERDMGVLITRATRGRGAPGGTQVRVPRCIPANGTRSARSIPNEGTPRVCVDSPSSGARKAARTARTGEITGFTCRRDGTEGCEWPEYRAVHTRTLRRST